jgi:hypothetical protein
MMKSIFPRMRDWMSSVPGIVILLLIVFVWRRPVEWYHPYVWVEEGTITLPAYLEQGWRSLWAPVAGYLVLPAKLIFLTSISLSASHYPTIAYGLTLIFEIGTIVLIAYSPTHLRFPKLAALSVALIPTQPEVFAISEYAFWWGALWSFVAVFWREGEQPRTTWRCALTAVGGLSSPMAVPAAVLLGYRAFKLPQRGDRVVFAVAVLVAAIQCVAVVTATVPMGFGKRYFDAVQIVVRFFGHYVISSERLPVALLCVIGLAILGVILGFAIDRQKWHDKYFVMLVGALCAAIMASISRVAIDQLHPVLGGPRYFFYPYIFLTWLLLYIYGEASSRMRAFIGVVFACAFTQFLMHGRQEYDTFRWRAELGRCINAGNDIYQLPIQFAGPKTIAWHVALKGTQCQQLVDQSIFK